MLSLLVLFSCSFVLWSTCHIAICLWVMQTYSLGTGQKVVPLGHGTLLSQHILQNTSCCKSRYSESWSIDCFAKGCFVRAHVNFMIDTSYTAQDCINKIFDISECNRQSLLRSVCIHTSRAVSIFLCDNVVLKVGPRPWKECKPCHVIWEPHPQLSRLIISDTLSHMDGG